MLNPIVQRFFHQPSSTFSYVVWDPDGPGGVLPPVEDNGVAYFKVPVNQLGRGR